jgi:hypothetical protein
MTDRDTGVPVPPSGRTDTRTFVAVSADGTRVTVHARIRAQQPIDLVTTNGHRLGRVSRGVYVVEATGEVLTSEDPAAP